MLVRLAFACMIVLSISVMFASIMSVRSKDRVSKNYAAAIWSVPGTMAILLLVSLVSTIVTAQFPDLLMAFVNHKAGIVFPIVAWFCYWFYTKGREKRNEIV